MQGLGDSGVGLLGHPVVEGEGDAVAGAGQGAGKGLGGQAQVVAVPGQGVDGVGAGAGGDAFALERVHQTDGVEGCPRRIDSGDEGLPAMTTVRRLVGKM